MPGPDTLFLLDPVDEGEVLNNGGRLAEAYTDYFAVPDRIELVEGPFWRKGLSQPGGPGHPAFIAPVDGLLPTDEFTITFWVRGRDDAELIRAGDHLVVTQEANAIRARWLPAGVELTLALESNPIRWRCVSVVWDGSALTVIEGDGHHRGSATGTAGPVDPVSGKDGGLRLLGGTEQAHDVELAEVHIQRFARILDQPTIHHGPTVAVDLRERGAPFPVNVTGVLGLYTGFRLGRDGAEPDIGTAIRDAQFRGAAEAGMPLYRLGGVVSATTVTDNGEGAEPRYSYDFSILDDKLDLLAELGVRFHVTLDYNHPLTGADLDDYPSLLHCPDDLELYAELCSTVTAHLREKYDVASVGFWNEPDIPPHYWRSSQEEFYELWRTVQRRFTKDHPDLLLTSTEAATLDGIVNHLRDIGESGLPVTAACMHTYHQDVAALRRAIRTIRSEATAIGLPELPIRLPEWGMDILANQQRYDEPHSVVAAWPNRFRSSLAAAYCLAFVHEVTDVDPYVDLATFSSMGAVDYEYLRGAMWTIADEALFSSDDPPRPYPTFPAMSMLWMLTGDRVGASTNWPGLRAIATQDDDTTTVVFGSYRPWHPSETVDVSLTWEALPERFTWRAWQVDNDHGADGRLTRVGEGDETDLPNGMRLGVNSVACIQIQHVS